MESAAAQALHWQDLEAELFAADLDADVAHLGAAHLEVGRSGAYVVQLVVCMVHQGSHCLEPEAMEVLVVEEQGLHQGGRLARHRLSLDHQGNTWSAC